MVSPDSCCGIKKCLVKWMLQLSKEQVAVWNGDLEDYYYGEDFDYSDRRLEKS